MWAHSHGLELRLNRFLIHHILRLIDTQGRHLPETMYRSLIVIMFVLENCEMVIFLVRATLPFLPCVFLDTMQRCSRSGSPTKNSRFCIRWFAVYCGAPSGGVIERVVAWSRNRNRIRSRSRSRNRNRNRNMDRSRNGRRANTMITVTPRVPVHTIR